MNQFISAKRSLNQFGTMKPILPSYDQLVQRAPESQFFKIWQKLPVLVKKRPFEPI
jgi:hypothetical protein